MFFCGVIFLILSWHFSWFLKGRELKALKNNCTVIGCHLWVCPCPFHWLEKPFIFLIRLSILIIRNAVSTSVENRCCTYAEVASWVGKVGPLSPQILNSKLHTPQTPQNCLNTGTGISAAAAITEHHQYEPLLSPWLSSFFLSQQIPTSSFYSHLLSPLPKIIDLKIFKSQLPTTTTTTTTKHRLRLKFIPTGSKFISIYILASFFHFSHSNDWPKIR